METKDELILLCKQIESFVRNPIIDKPGTVDAQQLGKARRDLQSIVELSDESFRMKKSLETASKLGARYALIVGENEVKADAFGLKNLETGETRSAVTDAAELRRKAFWGGIFAQTTSHILTGSTFELADLTP